MIENFGNGDNCKYYISCSHARIFKIILLQHINSDINNNKDSKILFNQTSALQSIDIYYIDIQPDKFYNYLYKGRFIGINLSTNKYIIHILNDEKFREIEFGELCIKSDKKIYSIFGKTLNKSISTITTKDCKWDDGKVNYLEE